jgi:hypothetical protein
MTEFHDRQSMERLRASLARAEHELRDAQHFLDPGPAEAAEMDIVHAVGAARLAVTTALERVDSRLGEPGAGLGGVNTRATESLRKPRESPTGATEQPGRVGPQPAVESTRGEESSPLEAQESHEMHMPEVHGGPREQPSERPWWRRMFGG